jgi:hypothetical protein
MIKINDDDDEPLFRVRYIEKGGYWEEYNRMTKTWTHLCNKDKCTAKICKSSDTLCTNHYNKENKPKKKSKRLNTNIKKKNTKQELPLETIFEDKV